MSKIIGAQAIINSLINEGVDVMFGIPGGTVIPLFDVIYDTAEIKFILSRHEQGAVHMADGYARTTGKAGVVIVTSGPGATNTVTGILNAYMDSIPMVIFTGQVALPQIGNDSFQEADTVGITRPITKHNYLVTDVNDIPRIVKEAFHITRTGRPGPVLIDIPFDIQREEIDYEYPKNISIRGYNPKYEGHPQQIERVANVITKSKRPVIYSGGGVILSNASEELGELARKSQIPVTSTLLGLGAFPETDTLSLGMLGMHGTWYSNKAVQECDLLICIGARFDNRITGNVQKFSPNSVKIHIDIDPTNIGKVVETKYPIVGDIKRVLKKLIPKISKLDTKNWLKTIYGWKMEHPLKYEHNDVIKPQYVIEKIYELTKGDAIISTSVGQHQMWVAQYYKFTKPRTLLSSGGLGTMGYGFPAAIGAAVGNPDKVVFSISGDGSFQMNLQELATAVKLGLNVKVCIMNNGYLGMVRQWQDLFYNKRYSGVELKDCNPDFVKLAESYGAVGLRAENTSDVDEVLKKAIEINNIPVLIDFKIEEEENVYPMIPAGRSMEEIMDR